MCRFPVTPYEGHDPVAYVLSSNINRRHMTKGQRAMAVAKIYPVPKRGIHSELKDSTGGGFDKGYLSQARTVLRWAPELADSVLAGAESLDRAYASFKARGMKHARIPA